MATRGIRLFVSCDWVDGGIRGLDLRGLVRISSRSPLPTLEATKRHPEGSRAIVTRQPRSSAPVNKVLTNKKLLPTSEHKLYGLRHTFEDRADGS